MLPSFCEDLTSLNFFSLSPFSAEIWVITQSCLSKRTPSLRWRTCRSCEFDHGQLLLVFQCWCGTEHQVKLIMVCWESQQQTVLTSMLIPGPHFPLSPSTVSSSKKICKGIFYFSYCDLMNVRQISHTVFEKVVHLVFLPVNVLLHSHVCCILYLCVVSSIIHELCKRKIPEN